ncbi:unnamed protein product [Coffea canephora]|uniref:Peptidase A1 domain-containing protein n=1 Tax=Coffea canephora TaxID=49390 RepID=A0A068VGP2_COFCA|nr:unnamed protein product [Coffea canephora]
MALEQLPSTSNRLSFFKSTLFWLICSSVAISHGVEKPAKPHYHTVNVSSLLPKPYCTGHIKGSSVGSRKMVVTSKRGPCSQIPRTKEISAYEESLLEDENRVRSLNKRASNVHSKAADSGSRIPTSDSIPFSGEYITTIGLGTPKVDYQVIIDTGSDPTWVRCKPCSKGCKSENSLFDPSKSSTYLNGSCKPNSGNGAFGMNYLDKTYSRGYWGCDKLSLEPSDVFERFQFGCGLITEGGSGNFANGAGVLGLGRGDLSLVSQTASKFAKTFSYCLPKTSSSLGRIDFGDRARSVTASSGLKFTNLIKEPRQNIPSRYNRSSLYFLELLGISVAGSRLDVSPTIFTSVGTVIDSGTVITYLPPSAYTALSKNFKQSMADYPPAPSQEKLDTCYDVTGYGSIRLPEITLHFGGATDVSLNPSGIVWIAKKNPYIWCLGFAANKKSDDLTIIGNNQQRELDILYDIDAGKIGFGTKPCGD